MRQEIDEAEEGRLPAAGLVTSAVMGVMLLIMTTFLAQFPETQVAPAEQVAIR